MLNAWTLGRNGRRLTCALIGIGGGRFVLRLSHGGQRILEEEWTNPEQALARSLDVLRTFAVRGWVHESTAN